MMGSNDNNVRRYLMLLQKKSEQKRETFIVKLGLILIWV
jgi:hypothetical protein